MTLVHVTVWHVCEDGALWHLTGCPATHLLDKWLKRSAGMFVLPVSAGAFSYYHTYSQYTQHYPGVCVRLGLKIWKTLDKNTTLNQDLQSV